MKFDHKATICACFTGYIVQAIVNSFIPLLFVTFQQSYGIPLSKITLLITINFMIQLLVDLLSAGFVDRIGYRTSMLLAHGFAVTGFLLLAILPELFSDPFLGILLSVIVYAVGGGLLEVLVSPIIEACPTENKETTMSLLHSFYCWGCTGVILFSTLFFSIWGTKHWKALMLLWTIIPLLNMVLFTKVPIYSLQEEGEKEISLKELLKKKVFWLMLLFMFCAGASEQAVSQWASTFAEEGLGISKTVGDLVGPMSFSILMGISRLLYGKYGDKLDLDRFMKMSCALCIFSYLCISMIPVPVIGLLGCGICGFSVGILWPGTFSKSAAALRGGGTVLFALLALAGDLGCSAGPTLVGMASSIAGNELRVGILSAVIFPIVFFAGLSITHIKKS